MDTNHIHRYWEDFYRGEPRAAVSKLLSEPTGDRNHQREKYFFSRIRPNILGKTLLDVGCGAAKYVRQLLDPAELGYNYIGIDFSDEALRLARENVPSGTLIKASLPEIPIPGSSVDYIFSFGVLLYVTQWELALERLIEVLKPGGRLMLYEKIVQPRFAGFFRRRKPDDPLDGRTIDGQKLLSFLSERGKVVFCRKDYSPVRYALVRVFGGAMNASHTVTKIVIVADCLCIATLGRLFPQFDGRCLFVTYEKANLVDR